MNLLKTFQQQINWKMKSSKKSDKEIKETTEEIAEDQKQEQPELHHLPTEGKKPGEVEDFKKSRNNVEESEE